MNKLNFNEMTWENFSQWSVAIKCFVLFLSALFIGMVSYRLILKTDFYQYKKLLYEEKNLLTDIAKKKQIADIVSYQNQLTKLQNEYKEKLNKLVAKNEIANLLNTLAKTGTNSGLTVEFFAPQAEEKEAFLLVLPVHMVVIGEYQQLASFLSRIAAYRHLIGFHDFAIAKISLNQQAIATELQSDKLLRMEIKIKIYRH